MKRLLLIADRTQLTDGLRLMLRESQGFRIVGFADGRRVLAASLDALAPDVVLVDDMRRANDVLARLREVSAAAPNAKVVLLTHTMDGAWQGQAFDAGAHAVLSKSVAPAVLATLLRETASGTIVHRFDSAGIARGVRPEDCPLTEREAEILGLVAQGLTNARIARRLWVSQPTVKFHLANTYRKLGVANRTEASRYAHAHGLVAPVGMGEPAEVAPALTAA